MFCLQHFSFLVLEESSRGYIKEFRYNDMIILFFEKCTIICIIIWAVYVARERSRNFSRESRNRIARVACKNKGNVTLDIIPAFRSR